MKKKNGRGKWFFVPIWMALPVAAGILYVYLRYGQTISELLLAAFKVVIMR